MIKLYYAYTQNVSEIQLSQEVKPLSEKAQSHLSGLKREEDRLLTLAASFLLKEALLKNGFCGYSLCNLQHTSAGKPFFDGAPFDFSISHTENCAALAFSVHQKVGIDIEKIKPVDFADFETVFPPEVRNSIKSSNAQTTTFYSYWTLLESAVKADGRGLSLTSGRKMTITNNQVIIDGYTWYTKHQHFDPSISCCIASNIKPESVELIEVRLSWHGYTPLFCPCTQQ